FLLQKFVDFENAVDQAKESIRNESMYLIELHKKNLAHHIEKIKYPCLSLLASHRQKIERYQSQVVSESKNLFLKAKQALQLLQKQVEWLNPHRLLQLGYSLTFSKGKLVKSKTEVQIGDALQTHVADGYIYSQVLASPPEDPPI
ncbi:MAG: exodeoxyribonuclease VII large subunit, partial [Bacteroidales bacterium]